MLTDIAEKGLMLTAFLLIDLHFWSAYLPDFCFSTQNFDQISLIYKYLEFVLEWINEPELILRFSFEL